MPPNHDNQENLNFAAFLTEQMRDKGMSLKRLAELTGISPMHLEALLHGNFDEMPPTPYFRGYLVRLGKALSFDGEEWWKRIRKENTVRNSGPLDALPENRFIKKSPPKWIWLAAIGGILIIIYLSITLPRILGRPSLAITFPTDNPYVTTANTLTIEGVVHNTDALYLGNGDASNTESISISPDGSWQKSVLLQTGLNTFEFRAKKFLGAETIITEQVLYEAPGSSSSTASSTTSTVPEVHFPVNQPATGSYYQ